MLTDPKKLKRVLVTDCGSTTTKALLFEKKEDRWHQTFRGEAPTTVEEPVADVTVGALNAFNEVEELSGIKILSENQKSPFIVTEKDPTKGIDLYLSTSSAGGGLQMLVAGAARKITTDSAERAALGAGAIVMEAISTDDVREEHERTSRIRDLKPDIVLITGGVDGGATKHVVEIAETLLQASPKPRFGETRSLPVIYAGNKDAAGEVQKLLEGKAQVVVVPNVRPTLEEENLGPAREAIHEFFLSHVMSHSPGYGKLLEWSPVPVMPTPAAVGDIVKSYAESTKQNVIAVDIGGATTDVFSVFHVEDKPHFNRTVSANLGMSYSIANVLVEAGINSIKKWLPYELSDSELSDRLKNKMIRPTSIPQTLDDLLLEQAICREALRLSLKHHRSLAVGLTGASTSKSISDIFSLRGGSQELVDLNALDLVIGSGGVLSHAPNRVSAALMMLDGFELEGFTELAVDSIFMMPHLGVFASVHPEAAHEIFLGDCLVHLGYSIAPTFTSRIKKGEVLGSVSLNGSLLSEIVAFEVHLLDLKEGGEIQVSPHAKGINLGAGPGKSISKKVKAGGVGVLLDGRNRPIQLPDNGNWLALQNETFSHLGII